MHLLLSAAEALKSNFLLIFQSLQRGPEAVLESQKQTEVTEHLLLCFHWLLSDLSKQPGRKKIPKTCNASDTLLLQLSLQNSMISAIELVTS